MSCQITIWRREWCKWGWRQDLRMKMLHDLDLALTSWKRPRSVSSAGQQQLQKNMSAAIAVQNFRKKAYSSSISECTGFAPFAILYFLQEWDSVRIAVYNNQSLQPHSKERVGDYFKWNYWLENMRRYNHGNTSRRNLKRGDRIDQSNHNGGWKLRVSVQRGDSMREGVISR